MTVRRAAGPIGLFVIGCLAMALALTPRVALAQGVREAALVLRILSYDRNLPRRANGSVTILVVYVPGNRDSEGARDRMVSALTGLGSRTTVANMQPRTIPVAYRDRSSLEQAARSNHAVAAYICPGLEGSVSDVSQAARTVDMLSISGSRASAQQGLSVALVSEGSRVNLTINLTAVAAEGARLDATVLGLADVIR